MCIILSIGTSYTSDFMREPIVYFFLKIVNKVILWDFQPTKYFLSPLTYRALINPAREMQIMALITTKGRFSL